ncbi:MAG: IS110 family transposase [Thiotrichaceae bacterium]
MINVHDEFAVLIGLDWANKKHDVCLQKTDESTRHFEVIQSSPEAIEDWIQGIYKRVKGRIAVALELDKGPIVYALQKYSYVTIFPVHPLMLAKYRQVFSPSGAKDDPTDAELALDMMLKYPNKIKPLSVPCSEMRKLRHLVEQRRTLVDDKRRLANRLINSLKQYYPQPLDWFSHRDTDLFCEFICRWPTLQKVKRAHEATVCRFFLSKGGNATPKIEQRIIAIKQAIPLTNDRGVIESHQLLVMTLASQIQLLIKAIRNFDKEIDSLFESMEDSYLFKSLPGVGPCLGPRLLVAFGDDRNRFDNAGQVQNYTGIAPVTERSGQKAWIHWRWQCAKFLRQTFIEWAAKTVKTSYWAGLYYEKQRNKGNSHQSTIRALAFKWIRIVFRCWKSRTVYDESKYLKALRERNSPLIIT